MDRIMIMRSFVAVGDEGSFSRAARQLNISGSLISRHVAALEHDLDIRLVNRTARAVSLTAAGRRYHDFAYRVLHDLDAEDAALRGLGERAEGQLSVICPKWIGNLDLGEAIGDFAADHPKIHVKFEIGGMSEQAFDSLDQGFHVAFYTRNVRDPPMPIRELAALDFVLCASPRYIAARGGLSAPQELAAHDCLVHLDDPTWQLTRVVDGEEFKANVPDPVYSSNSYLTLHKAAVHGRGLALMPVRKVAADLDSGLLRQVASQRVV